MYFNFTCQYGRFRKQHYYNVYNAFKFDLFQDEQYRGTVIDHPKLITGFFENGLPYRTDEKDLVLSSPFLFTCLDPEGAVFADGTYIRGQFGSEFAVIFPQQNHRYEVKARNHSYLEFISGADTWCEISGNAGFNSSSFNNIFRNTPYEGSMECGTGSIQLGDGLPPEYIFPLLVMFNRFRPWEWE